MMDSSKLISWGVSVQGPAHISNQIPNQDAWLIAKNDSFDIDIFAVADGIGSCPKSDIGSKMACQAIVLSLQLMEKYALQSDIPMLIRLIHNSWVHLLKQKEILPEEASSTLLCVLKQGNLLTYIQIGDGLIFGKCLHRNILLSFPNQEEEKAFANVTNALHSRFHIQDWRYHSFEQPHPFTLFLCTDGVSDDLIQGKEALFLDRLAELSKEQGLGSISAYMTDFLSKRWPTAKHSDDKTIVFLGQW